MVLDKRHARNVFEKHFLEMSKNTVFYFGSPKFFTIENIFYKYLPNLEKEVSPSYSLYNDFYNLSEKLKEVNQIFVSVEQGILTILKSAP